MRVCVCFWDDADGWGIAVPVEHQNKGCNCHCFDTVVFPPFRRRRVRTNEVDNSLVSSH